MCMLVAYLVMENKMMLRAQEQKMLGTKDATETYVLKSGRIQSVSDRISFKTLLEAYF